MAESDQDDRVGASIIDESMIAAPTAIPANFVLVAVLSAIGGAIFGAVLSTAGVWATNQWEFMRDRTFASIERERDAATEERNSLEIENSGLKARADEISRSHPIRSRYGPKIETLVFLELSESISAPVESGSCGGAPCVGFAARFDPEVDQFGNRKVEILLDGSYLGNMEYDSGEIPWHPATDIPFRAGCWRVAVINGLRLQFIVEDDRQNREKLGVAVTELGPPKKLGISMIGEAMCPDDT